MTGTPMPENSRTAIEREADYRTKVDMLMKTVFDNGQPGLLTRFNGLEKEHNSFYECWVQREEDKKKFDDRSSQRQIALIALATLILGLLAFFGIRATLTKTAFVGDNRIQTAHN